MEELIIKALIIKGSIGHYQISKYQTKFLQTSIIVEDWNGCIIISVVYSLHKHVIEREYYIIFFKTVGNCFIIARDYNAKHTY